MKSLAILLFAALPVFAGEITLFNGKDLTGWIFHSAGGCKGAIGFQSEGTLIEFRNIVLIR